MAVAAAEAAGEVLRDGFGRQHRIEYKGEANLVTEADEEAERKIGEILRQAFPDYGLLTEEGGEKECQSDARWIVDPLDGTTNYAHGVPFFCTSIALERAGEVVVGVVTTRWPKRPTPPSAGAVLPSTAIPRWSREPTSRHRRSSVQASPTVPRSWR